MTNCTEARFLKRGAGLQLFNSPSESINFQSAKPPPAIARLFAWIASEGSSTLCVRVTRHSKPSRLAISLAPHWLSRLNKGAVNCSDQPTPIRREHRILRWLILARTAVSTGGRAKSSSVSVTNLLAFVLFLVVGINTPAGVLYVNLNSRGPTPPFTNWATAALTIQDAIDAANAGDKILVTNGVYQTGGRVVFGSMSNRVAVTKPVVVQSVNGPTSTLINGQQASSGLTNGPGAVRCAYLTNNAQLIGFTLANGATVTSGLYREEQNAGGVWLESQNAVVSNCVIVGNSAAQSGGGAYSGTLIGCLLLDNSSVGDVGGGAAESVLIECSLVNNRTPISGGGAALCNLTNCTLSFNWASQEGGGAWAGILQNCLLTGNSAGNDAGGAQAATLNNCILRDNTAGYSGGAVSYRTVCNNCLLVSNSAPSGGAAGWAFLNNCTICFNSASIIGGGTWETTMNNCIAYYNSAPDGPNYAGAFEGYGGVNYCCVTPLPDLSLGHGNFTNAPRFLDLTSGDLRLSFDSLCINSGNNSLISAGWDLDGNPRIVGGAVDAGAYEFQMPSSVISYAWLNQYGLPADGTADYMDLDNDGMNNWQEWIAGTDPTNPSSLLKMLASSNNISGITISWQSVSGVTYFLQRSANFSTQPAFSTIQSNIIGQAGTTSFTDTTTNAGPYFYRVGVQQ